MAIWEFSICVKDAVEDGRKKAGDIISFIPQGKPWGDIPIRNCLIVSIDGLTREQAQRLCFPRYLDGRETELAFPDPQDITPELIEKLKEKPLAKRKFSMPLDRLKQILPLLDLERVADEKDAYQPFLDGKVVLQIESVGDLIYDKHIGNFGDTRGS